MSSLILVASVINRFDSHFEEGDPGAAWIRFKLFRGRKNA